MWWMSSIVISQFLVPINCSLHTTITHVITVLDWWSLVRIPMVAHKPLLFQYWNHVSDCSVQCAIGTSNHEMTVPDDLCHVNCMSMTQ